MPNCCERVLRGQKTQARGVRLGATDTAGHLERRETVKTRILHLARVPRELRCMKLDKEYGFVSLSHEQKSGISNWVAVELYR